jgi:hypothetical protein
MRSFTVEDTKISEGPASPAIREPMCTAIPRTFSPSSSTSPVCSPGSKLDPEIAHRVADGHRASHCANRPVERGQEPVARGVHFASSEPAELGAYLRVVVSQERQPPVISELGRLRCRANDVGEHHGREDAIEFGLFYADLLHEPVDLVEQPVPLADPEEMIDFPGAR